jgi:hypothetical protein
MPRERGGTVADGRDRVLLVVVVVVTVVVRQNPRSPAQAQRPGACAWPVRVIPTTDACVAVDHPLRQGEIEIGIVRPQVLKPSLFPGLGWRQVWQRLTAGLEGLKTAAPTDGALAQARRRVGAEPLRWLFDLLRGPAAGINTMGAWWRGLLVCAIDGTLMAVPDSPANQAEFIKHRCNNGGAGYPSLRLLVLVSCGTRTVLDAVFGPTAEGETAYAPRLFRSLHEGMIVLLDRNFAVQALVEAVTRTGAQVLVRVKEHRRLPVLGRFRDGSYLSRLGAVPVRVVDCEITISTSQGRRTGLYRLVTTLTDPHAHPAAELIRLYHER